MSTSFAFDSLPDAALPPYPVQRFTVEQYFEIAQVLNESGGGDIELLEGWIVPKLVKNPQHDNAVDVILGLLENKMPEGWFLRVQNVVQTADSAPEPDFAITRGKRGDYPARHPSGKDVGLVIEVADTSLSRDRRKAGIYAAAGIPCYWIVNLVDRRVEVFEEPMEGAYQRQKVMQGPEPVNIVLLGEHVGEITADQLLPPGS